MTYDFMGLTVYLNHFAHYCTPKCVGSREFSGIPRSLYTSFFTVVPEQLLNKSGSLLFSVHMLFRGRAEDNQKITFLTYVIKSTCE